MRSEQSIDVVAIRRDLHAHPELAFAEHRTTELIVDRCAPAAVRLVGPSLASGVTALANPPLSPAPCA